jgi:hypothetical protein
MANKFTDAVSDAILPSATMKMVLMTLARFTNNETGVCWPGQTLIAKLSCCSYSAAQRNLDELINMKLVAVTGQHPIKNSTAMYTNEYTLDLDEIQALSLYTEHKCLWEPHPDLHHLLICSQKKCGKLRSAFVWTKYDDLEAEFMARQDELYELRAV